VTDLHTLANAISDQSPAIKTFALAVADKLEPVTPPAPSGKLWGISPSNDPYTVAISTQMTDFVLLNASCPRIPGDDATATAARAANVKHWFAWLGKSTTPAQAVAYAQKYPEAIGVGVGNELNLGAGWTTKQVAAMQANLYAAMDAAGFANRVLLSSVGNSKSEAEGLLPLDWCKALASLGCVKGKGFAIADYHMYAANPQNYDNWMHVWTPFNGASCQSVFGNPPFIISEFGAKIGKDVPANTADHPTQGDDAQAAAVTAWVAKLKSLPDCMGGALFQDYEGTDARWTGYGLHDSSGNRRPSWQAYKSAIA